jgi:hypothetical protein
LGTFATGGERPLAVGLKETPPEGMAGGVLSRQILRGLGDRDLPSSQAVNSLRRYFVPLGAQMMSGSGGAECEFHRSACWCRDPVFPSALPRSRLSEMEPAYPAALSEPGAWSAPAADTPRLRGRQRSSTYRAGATIDWTISVLLPVTLYQQYDNSLAMSMVHYDGVNGGPTGEWGAKLCRRQPKGLRKFCESPKVWA